MSKSHLLVIASAISNISADWLNMNNMFEKLVDHHKNLTNTQNTQFQQRNVRPWLNLPGLGMQDLDNWGCWCYFGSDDPHKGEYKGHGEPVDKYLDVACRNLRLAYDCMIIDAADGVDEEDICIPWEITYNSGLVFGLNSVEKMCSKYNQIDSCAYKACTVEGSFVIKIFDFVFMDGLTIDPVFSHNNGFNPDEECMVREPNHEHNHEQTSHVFKEITTTKPPAFRMVENPALQQNHLEKSCCGEYPNRYPFKPLKGFHKCCDGKVYETTEKECCLDGSLKKLGMCDVQSYEGEIVDADVAGSGDYDILGFYEGDGGTLNVEY